MWCKEIEEGQVYSYGIKCLMEDEERDDLISELNKVAVELRKGNTEMSLRSYKGDPYKFVNEHR